MDFGQPPSLSFCVYVFASTIFYNSSQFVSSLLCQISLLNWLLYLCCVENITFILFLIFLFFVVQHYSG